jgi:hypothetical protein
MGESMLGASARRRAQPAPNLVPLAFNARAGYPPRVAARRSLADLLDGELHARSRTNADTQRSSPRRSRRTTSRSRGRDCCSSTRSGSDDHGILSGSVTAHAAPVECPRWAAVTGGITAERTAPRRRLRVLCTLAG